MVKGIRHEVSLLKEVKYPVACKASELHFFFFFSGFENNKKPTIF